MELVFISSLSFFQHTTILDNKIVTQRNALLACKPEDLGKYRDQTAHSGQNL